MHDPQYRVAHRLAEHRLQPAAAPELLHRHAVHAAGPAEDLDPLIYPAEGPSPPRRRSFRPHWRPVTTETTLRYDSPADVWTDALPLGNGRIGAMVFGGVALERLQLNDDTCWAGATAPARQPQAGPRWPPPASRSTGRLSARPSRQVQRLQGVGSCSRPTSRWWTCGWSRTVTGRGTSAGSGSTRGVAAASRWGVGYAGRRSSATRPSRRRRAPHVDRSGPLRVRVTSEHPLDQPTGDGSRWSATLRLSVGRTPGLRRRCAGGPRPCPRHQHHGGRGGRGRHRRRRRRGPGRSAAGRRDLG